MALPAYPVSREETYLAKIAGESVTLPSHPVTRQEQYLAKIAGEDVTLPGAPVTRKEIYLAKWAGETVTLPDHPVTRIEQYLSVIVGASDTMPASPVSRVEQYLAAIADTPSTAEVDIATLTWNENLSYLGLFILAGLTGDDAIKPADNDETPTWVSLSGYAPCSQNASMQADKTFSINNNGNGITIYDSSYDNKEALMAAMTDRTLRYEKA